MRRLKSWLFFWPTFAFCTVLIIPPFVFGWATKNSKLISRCSWMWGAAVMWASGVELEVEGEIPSQGSYVVVSNHSSLLDVAASLAVLMRDLEFRFVSRRSWSFIPFFGQAMVLSGCPVISRPKKNVGDTERARRKARKRTKKSLDKLRGLKHFKRGISIMIFPEGTRTRTGEMKAFKGGAFLMAAEHEVSVLPIRFEGLFEAMPKGRRFPKPGSARVYIGPPISARGKSPTDRKLLGRTVESWIAHAA